MAGVFAAVLACVVAALSGHSVSTTTFDELDRPMTAVELGGATTTGAAEAGD